MEVVVEDSPYKEESRKTRREGEPVHHVGAKRRKVENDGLVWGEKVSSEFQPQIKFLKSNTNLDVEIVRKSTQSKVKSDLYTGK